MTDEDLRRVLRARHVDRSPTYDKRSRRKRLASEAAEQLIPGGWGAAGAARGNAPFPDRHSLSEPRRCSKWNDTASHLKAPAGPRVVLERRLPAINSVKIAESATDQAEAVTFVSELETGSAQDGGGYAELHSHSNYSFREGASYTAELLVQAKKLGLAALALTDHNNLCGAMEFAQAAKSVGIKAIIGVELTLTNGHHLTLLAENAEGYKNLSLLTTRAHMDPAERNEPALAPALLAEHSRGVICLSGCRSGEISSLVMKGDLEGARRVARQYLEWFGPQNFFLELQQNLVLGDTRRNRFMAAIGQELGIGIVATNNVHYHVQARSRLNDALVAIQHNRSLEETHLERRPNNEFYLKSPAEMAKLFAGFSMAISNTKRIAERCDLDLTSARVYDFPDYPVPAGHTPVSWLRKVCEDAAVRRYGAVTPPVRERLDHELKLLEKHKLAGFILQYHDIIETARDVQVELGMIEPGLPIEEQPPGRGRGSSVALLCGYLAGLSHIDPLQFGLRLERFLTDEMSGPPDIDLDFPRNIREELILRVHQKWGYERAVLTGMISTYKIRGAVRDLGKALGLPDEDVDKLSKRLDGHTHARQLYDEMRSLPDYRDRADSPLWQELIGLAQQLEGFPKYLAQHPGGMILSARPLSETVPLQRSAIDGRFICQWDKDSADDAGFVKIDFLALGALSQMNEALQLVRKRTEERIDLSRIDFEDPAVYADIHRADTIGVFQIESAAQMQTVVRLKPKNLFEMAWEVGAVRPGVGVNDGVSMLIRRHTGLEPVWEYDHPLEKAALERTYGVPLYQDQLVELGVHVAGMSAAEADRMRRAFSRRNRHELIPVWKEKFLAGALKKGVPPDAALKIFGKFHGEYQFPESHAFAFGITAYQMSWLKHYFPLEFFVGLYNQQPMGFYNLETLKEDAKRHGIQILNPDVNLSNDVAIPEAGCLRLGLTHVAKVRAATVKLVLFARSRHGPFKSVADFMARTGLQQEALDNLADAGAFDSMDPERRQTRWEIGLRYRPVGRQLSFEMAVDQDMVALPGQSRWELAVAEYRTMGLYPKGHLMAMVRPKLPPDVRRSEELHALADGTEVKVAGIVIRRQRPLARAVFLTLEDEFGHSPLVVWPQVYERLKWQAKSPILLARGTVSHRAGTMNVVVSNLTPIEASDAPSLKSKDWG
ncbi:MAG: DNA polymerase III subunit alpha [SAR202 cluster bacterium]|nr:DNA polymerase III subunit alpha [SAR202 cluster bacterium]